MTGVQVPIVETAWAALAAFSLAFAGAELHRTWGSPETAAWAALVIVSAESLWTYAQARARA